LRGDTDKGWDLRRMNRGTCRRHGKRLKGWDVLDIPGLDGAALPRLQDLGDTLVYQPEPDSNGFIAPAKREIQLDNLPLQIGTVVPFKYGHLAREGDQVSPDRSAQLIDTQTTQSTLIERGKIRSRRPVQPATTGHQRVVVPLHRSYSLHLSSVRLNP